METWMFNRKSDWVCKGDREGAKLLYKSYFLSFSFLKNNKQ